MRSLLALAAVGLVLTAPALASAWPGPPASKPPRLQQPGPPPAWIETRTKSTWLAYSSYCWKTTCADFLPPASRTDLPIVRVVRGAAVRIHFAFVPRDARVTLISAHAGKRTTLQAARIATWRPSASGVAVVETHAAAGSASYAARVVLK
jgi:hypothetical protein